MKYTQFASHSMKERISWVQERLISKGYLKDGDSKPTKEISHTLKH